MSELCVGHTWHKKNDAQKRNFDLWDASEHNSPSLLSSSSLLKNFTILTFGYFSVYFINFELWFNIGGRIGQNRPFLFEWNALICIGRYYEYENQYWPVVWARFYKKEDNQMTIKELVQKPFMKLQLQLSSIF